MTTATVTGTRPRRRTQQERRDATVRKLLDATTDALVEVGYARTSVQEICNRAEISQGGLFRHFSSRLELMIRTGDDIGDGLLELYRRDFQSLRSRRGDELALALKLLRGNVQSRLHQAWFELLMAARTDAALREALTPIWKRRDDAMQRLAAELLPDRARALPDFAVIVDTMVTLFHGEAVDRFIRIDADAERRRMNWLLHQLRPLFEER
jgi:AcrR family transcriptional regulator